MASAAIFHLNCWIFEHETPQACRSRLHRCRALLPAWHHAPLLALQLFIGCRSDKLPLSFAGSAAPCKMTGSTPCAAAASSKAYNASKVISRLELSLRRCDGTVPLLLMEFAEAATSPENPKTSMRFLRILAMEVAVCTSARQTTSVLQ